jgi:hypothetical protein
MSNAQSANTPLPGGYVPVESKEQCTPQDRLYYQLIIGSLLYIMLGTHPDITYAVTKLVQFSINPSNEHTSKVLHIVCYLRSTSKYTMVFDGSNDDGVRATCKLRGDGTLERVDSL